MRSLVTYVDRGIRYLRIGLGILAGVLILAVFFCVSANVFGRFVLNASYDWAEEMSRFFFIWAVLLGGGVGCLANENIAVSLVKDKVPRPVAAVFEILKIIIIYAVCVIIFVAYHDLVSGYVSSTPILGMSKTYLYMAMLVLAALMFLANTSDLLRFVTGIEREA
jgi:TRAP-type C4-dicarboxylate transport system permease small subunit